MLIQQKEMFGGDGPYLNIATYQAVSGAGAQAIRELDHILVTARASNMLSQGMWRLSSGEPD